jgi:hypothetical protein
MATKSQLFGLFLSLLALLTVSRESSAASAPTVSISASPTFVAAGEQSRITWSTKNATQCIGSGNWTGVKPLSDSKNTRRLTTNETFTLTCTGPGGSATNHATVVLSSGGTTTPAPTVTLNASPNTVTSGSKTTINWSASNATACSGSGAWSGGQPLSGTKSTGAVTADLTFAITCSGSGGNATASTTVSVASAPVNGYATLSWSAPTTNTNGTPISALAGYHLYYGNSSGALTQAIAVSGAATTSYEITGLTAGTWYFAVAADGMDGTESAQSPVGSKTI